MSSVSQAGRFQAGSLKPRRQAFGDGHPGPTPRDSDGTCRLGSACVFFLIHLYHLNQMATAKEYVKRFTTVPEAFVDELFEMMSESTRQSEIVIDLDRVAKWLNMLKSNLLKTLRRSYVLDVDYTVKREPKANKGRYGGNNRSAVRVSPSCFKELAMRSNSKNSALVRMYLLQVEDAFIGYRAQTLEGLKSNVATLLANQKPRTKPGKPGYVYMIRVKDGVSLHDVSNGDVHIKLGHTMQMQSRMDVYDTGFADKVDVLYQVQTDDMVAVEACVKLLCKEKLYRNRKEVYTIDVDVMKKVIDHCALGAAEVRRVPGRHTQRGGYFAVVVRHPGSERLKSSNTEGAKGVSRGGAPRMGSKRP